ncbi:MAG: glycosyltransferase family 39 protein [Anaerolineales bacterium]|jgi:uncharacterized membrane protein|nr:glycosyltransferase family 39 protein [Anaerolineales bacterium]
MKRLARLAPRDWIGLGLVLAGLALRLRQYLVNRSLWLDEAMLANNILSRDVARLLQPLDNDQGAPIGFLILQKSVTLYLGSSEYALRLIPFLAGCLTLALMFLLVRKTTGAFAGSLALALFAFSPALVSYSSEAKQYSSDAAIALALFLLFLRLAKNADNGRSSREFPENANDENGNSQIRGIRDKENMILLALAGALAVWLSHPALFVVGALGLALFLSALRGKDRRGIAALLLVGAVWIVNLAALYFLNLRQLSTHQFFLDFWREGFVPRGASAFAWIVDSLRAPFADLLGLRIPYLVSAPLFLIGTIGLTRRLPRFGLFLLLTFLLALLASFLTLYPFAGRMILFLAPALTLLLAEGAETLAALLSRPRWLAWTIRLVLAASLLFGPVALAYENFAAPKLREHIRPTMEYLRDYYKEGDIVYVYHWAEHAVRFYAPKYGLCLCNFIFGEDHHDQPELYRPELDALRGRARVWFLFSHVYERGDFNERDYVLSYLNSIGRLTREYRVPGTSVYLYLYDLR